MMPLNEYVPVDVEVVDVNTPVASLVTVIFTPGMTAPVESVTVPVTPPVAIWATPECERNTVTNSTSRIENNDCEPPLCVERWAGSGTAFVLSICGIRSPREKRVAVSRLSNDRKPVERKGLLGVYTVCGTRNRLRTWILTTGQSAPDYDMIPCGYPAMSAADPQTVFRRAPAEFSGQFMPPSVSQNNWPQRDLERDLRWQLAQRVAASRSFAKSAFLAKFLLYVCERELTARADEISEQQIGVQVFGRRPDYNPGEDNIVRNYARQLRQRLEAYFEEDGQQEKIRIVIPRGGYVPVFSPRATPEWAAAGSPPPESEELRSASAEVSEPRAATRTTNGSPERRRRIPLYATAIFILICAVVTGYATVRFLFNQHRDPSHILWTQLFNTDHLTYIVPADDGIVMFQNLMRHLVPLAEYVNWEYLSVKPPPTVDRRNMSDLEAQRYTSVTDLNAVLRLRSLSESRSDHTIVRYARELHIQDLKDANAILVGSRYSNPWVELFEKNLNFHFNYEPTPNASFIRNSNPQVGELQIYRNDASAPSHQTYGVIALAHNLNRTGWVLIVEGLTMAGTQAAVDTLFDSQTMQPILVKARDTDGTLRPFEVLIETRSFGSNSPQAKIVATRFYAR